MVFSWGKLNFRFEVDSVNLVPYTLEIMLKYYSVYTVTTDYMSKILDFSGGCFFLYAIECRYLTHHGRELKI